MASKKTVLIGEIGEREKQVANEIVDLFSKHELSLVEAITVIRMIWKAFEEEYGLESAKVW